LTNGHPCSSPQSQCLVTLPVQTVDATTIWYKADFKGGVYEAREAVWAFAAQKLEVWFSLDDGADVA